ncbi:MAG: hypothetical protein A2033_10895 [Bacteroidetes bacterium GWA2_31_9]|nr:MAG: hypothetical protein A2033_10895 [Bacteroidetes bacterium GWA2_31_9]
MQTESFKILAVDGLKLNFIHWFLPNPKAVLILIHGIGEHSGRYNYLASRFVSSGINVVSIDYRGHGLAEGKRGHINSYSELLNDIDSLFNQIPFYYQNIPKILYGHSMGGNIALNYAMRHNHSIKLIVATSPWIGLYKKTPAWLMFFAKMMNKIYPSYTQKVTFRSSELTHDSSVLEKHKQDNLNHGLISPRMFFEMTDAGIYLLLNSEKLKIKTLLLHGTLDSITSFKSTEEFYNKTSKYSTLKLWDGMFHELHNETEKDVVIDYIIDWILKNTNELKSL